MSKSKGSAAAIRYEHPSGDARLRPTVRHIGAKAAVRNPDGGTNAERSSIDTPVGDDDFEADAPLIGPAASSPEIEAEEEFDLEAPPGEGGGGDVLVARKAPSDKEIEEGGGDSMLARYFREMATHAVMGPEEEYPFTRFTRLKAGATQVDCRREGWRKRGADTGRRSGSASAGCA